MFDLGWSKILILAVVAIVVVGPKELPALLRTLGQVLAQLRRHAADFRAQFDDAMRSTELDQIKKDVEAIKSDAEASLRGIERTIEEDISASKASLEASLEAADQKIKALDAAVETAATEPAAAPDTGTVSVPDRPHLSGSGATNVVELVPPVPPVPQASQDLGTAVAVPAKTGA